MMSAPVKRTPVDKLREISPEIADGFTRLRDGVLAGGPLDVVTVELVVVGALAATRQHDALRVHLRRLLELKTDLAAIRHALVAPFGAALTLTETIEALDVLEELVAVRT
jgi:alkylhydroperoxidase/carboxymuconolactone decarboxylase family protein YurZ